MKKYTEQECREIFLERNSYVLQCIHSYGDDYGGSHCTDEREVTYEEIIPERILVKDRHFCGVLIYTDYDDMNGGCRNDLEEAILLIDGKGKQSARSGFLFSNDDHSRWDYVDYYLMSRDIAEKMDDWNG